MRWVIVDIGCIECGEPTEIVGVYEAEDACRDAYLEHVKKHGDVDDVREATGGFDAAGCGTTYFQGGQHEIAVFRVSL